jgi:chemotaxis signal transduction protein
MPTPEQWFCHFHTDTGPIAVSMESVAGVLETDSLVRLAWSPPQVVGMCSYHREVVPVVTLGDFSRGVSKDRPERRDQARAAGSRAAKVGIDESTRFVLLILKTKHGAWGLRVDSEHTIMSRERPQYHAPQIDADGAMRIGTVRRAGVCYGILDAEATWRGLRSAFARWLELTCEILPSAPLPSGAEPIQAGPSVVGGLLKA